MLFEKLLDSIGSWIIYIGLPVVALYHEIRVDPFLSISSDDAQGIEKVADTLLVPVHYLICGNLAEAHEENGYTISQKFDYSKNLSRNTFGSVIAFPVSLIGGYLIKSLALLSETTQAKYHLFYQMMQSTAVSSNNDKYKKMGIEILPLEKLDSIESQHYQRNTKNLLIQQEDFDCFKDVVSIFNEKNILYWLDCGSCLGAYRYGGVIPWDQDIDIAILMPDFQNVMTALRNLDKKKYHVQDWSSRDFPGSYIRIYVRKTHNHIDIYHFSINKKKKEVCYFLSNECSDFMPQWWRIREKRFITPTSFSTIFPLKRAQFDGIEVLVPNQIEKYLQERYGHDLRPAKLYNPDTEDYERDETHPYWEKAFVH